MAGIQDPAKDSGVILNPQELIDYTHKERPSAQARQLDALGIPHRPRLDGSLIVLWEDVRGAQNARPAPRIPRLRLDA